MDKEKLPKWARELIHDLERERDVSIRALNEFVDNQTPSPFSYSEYICTGENTQGGPSNKTKYIQTRRVTVNHEGVELEICLRDDGISISWSGEDRSEEIAFIPSSYQSARLVNKKNMR